MSDMFMVAKQLVKGCQTLVMDPTSPLQQSLVNTVPHTIMVHWYHLVQGENFRIWWQERKSGLTFWQHIIDVWHVHGGKAACQGLSDLGNGPNKPTTTIIGEYSASYHHGALISLGSGWEFQDLTKIWPNFLATHHWCLTCSWWQSSLSRVVRPW